MATGQKGKGRPANNVRDAENQKNTSSRGKVHKILFSLSIAIGVFIVFFLCFMIYYNVPQLKKINHLGDFYEKVGETWHAILIQLITVFCTLLGGGILIEWRRKQKVLRLREWIGLAIVVSVCISCAMSTKLLWDAKSILTKYQEETVASQSVPSPIYQVINTSGTEHILVEKINYFFEDDPYVSLEKIDGYRGVLKGTTQKEGNEIEQAAGIIYEDILTTFSEQTDVSEEEYRFYEENTQKADAFYVEYKKAYDDPPDGSILEVEQFMRQGRIGVLEQATDCRVEADIRYKDAENRRILAVYYTEKGDEQQAAGNMKQAEECFEQSARWAMQALYLAVPGTNVKKMQECLERLKIASTRMAGINGSRSKDLDRVVNIYTRVVEMRTATLQG